MSAQTDPYRSKAIPHYLSGLVFAHRARPGRATPAYAIVGHYNAALEWVSLDDFIDTVRPENTTSEGFSAFWTTPPATAADGPTSRAVKAARREPFADCLTRTAVYSDWVSCTRFTPLRMDRDY